MRKLATIQKLHNIRSIPERDRVDVASILGWDVIVGKNIYQENELVVFCEIDSVFPKTEFWAELEKFKYRIKTFKVNTPDGPIYGQGYCFPISRLEELVGYEVIKDLREGDEVTELIGITKYEPPEPSNNSMLIGNSRGPFPTSFIPKTDETRLESCLEILEELKGQPYVITLKIDGSSWTALPIDEHTVCSRNNMIKKPEDGIKSEFWDMYYKYVGIKELLDNGYAIQAEIYGEGIQKNHLKMKGKHLAAFNISDMKTRKYVDFDDFRTLCETFEIPMAPIIEEGESFNHTFESLKNLADNLKYESGKPAEGIVIRPKKEQWSRTLQGRMSFKQISRVFLSKDGD